MAEEARPALGLSIGATNLAAVTADHAITRKPVLTLYRRRPPEVGVPSENPRLDEPGLVIADFVDRVGDPVGIVAADGSMHRSEALVADGLRVLAYTATGGRALPENVTVTHPAHWGPAAVDTLGTALSRVSDWSNRASNRTEPLLLIPDAAAALFAVRANPGIPARGIVAVCDFGGSGTSITLVDAARECHPVAPTVRHHGFSGDLIDQSLLTHVMSELPNTGSFDPSGNSAIGSLTRLRMQCRNAKEQLSLSTVTMLTEGLPATPGNIRVTRNELEEAIRDSLDGVVKVLEETMGRSGIHTGDLAAIVSVGGGANIPAVTTKLSGHFRVPVVTSSRPHLAAAIGGALRAARGPGDNSATVLTPAAATWAPAAAGAAALTSAPARQLAPVATGAGQDIKAHAPPSMFQPELAWSEAGDDSRSVPVNSGGSDGGSGFAAARPQLTFDRDSEPAPEPKRRPVVPWYRLPAVIVIAAAAAVLLVGMAVAIALDSGSKPSSPGSPGVDRTPAPGAPPSQAPASLAPASPAPEGQAPPIQQAPPPPAAADTPAPPSSAADTTAPAPVAPPSPVAPQQAPVPHLPAPPNPPQLPGIPQIPPIPRIPGIGA